MSSGAGRHRRAGPQRGKARHRLRGRRREHVGRHVDMGDAARAIGLGDRLVEDGGRLLGRGDGLRINGHIAEQEVGRSPPADNRCRARRRERRPRSPARARDPCAPRRAQPRGDCRRARRCRSRHPACRSASPGRPRQVRRPSSWRTPIHSIRSCRRIASVKGLRASPTIPKTWRTPISAKVWTSSSATVEDMRALLSAKKSLRGC